jgi:UDP-glucose 4-epimerase
MSTVLVTGATTPVGVAVVRKLLALPRFDGVLAVIPPGSALPAGLDRDGRIQPAHADLTRERDVRTLVFGAAREAGVEVVVHLAAHRAARTPERRARRLNVESLRWLADAAERQGRIRRLVLRSHADVYRVRHDMPTIIREDHPLDLSPEIPAWVRDRVEADLMLSTRIGVSPLEISLLRGAECLAPDSGSQLWDYLSSRVCFCPAGFDPMINVVSVEDLADALHRAAHVPAVGAFNVPGADTLPLSAAIARAGRLRLQVPGPLLGPLYGLRAVTRGGDFRYDQNYFRFHFGGVMAGERAAHHLGYVPRSPIRWSELFPSTA